MEEGEDVEGERRGGGRCRGGGEEGERKGGGTGGEKENTYILTSLSWSFSWFLRSVTCIWTLVSLLLLACNADLNSLTQLCVLNSS